MTKELLELKRVASSAAQNQSREIEERISRIPEDHPLSSVLKDIYWTRTQISVLSKHDVVRGLDKATISILDFLGAPEKSCSHCNDGKDREFGCGHCA